jgi:hypothetical protein
VSVLVIRRNEGVDLIAHLLWRGEAGAGQGSAGEDGEPDLDLVEPGGVGWGEVKTDAFVVRQPPIIFGLVRVEIVQNDVDFAARVVGDDAVHEIQELDPPAALVMAGLDHSGGHLQRREQGGRASPLVLMVDSFNQPWAGSRAGMCGFSSTDNTTAFSGGCR